MAPLLALVVLLLAGSANPAGFGRGGGLTCPKGYIGGGLTPCVPIRLAFEFAPASGAGMGTACACAAVTGANGEAMTMTRASTATCSKQGAATTGIAPGDLVTCGANLPRVEAVGTSLGYLREGTATNVDPRSSEIDDAAYGDFTGGGSAAPVLNGADAALAPSGDLTAEDYTFDATTAAQGSARAISVLTAAAYSAQVWVRGVTGSGAMDLCLQTGAAPTATCSTCTFTTATWTQCKVENVTALAAGQVYLGNLGLLSGIARPINRVYVWGLDAEAGAFASSYIPTAGATATRAADSALTGYASTTWGPDFSLAASVAFVDTSASATTVAQLGSATPNLAAVKTTNNTTAAYTIDSVSTGPTVAAMGSAQHRTALADASGSRGAWWDTGSVAAPAVSITHWFDDATDTAMTYVAGKIGLAASLNGTTSKAQTLVDGPLSSSPRSISLWAYGTDLGNGTYVSYGNNSPLNSFVMSNAGGSILRVFNGSADIISIPYTLLNTWIHFVVTYDGTTTRAYVDAAGPTTSAAAINTTHGAAYFAIGYGAVYGAFAGLIDDVVMWDRALTTSEVVDLYASGAGAEYLSGSLLTGLLHRWRLDGNSFDDYGKASLTIGAINARTSSVCADPNSARCR